MRQGMHVILKQEINCFIDREEIPETWYEEEICKFEKQD